MLVLMESGDGRNQVQGGSELDSCKPWHSWQAPEFNGSSKEPAPQPKAPELAPRFIQGSSLEEPDSGRFVHHSIPTRAENLQLSVSKHVTACTVNVSIGRKVIDAASLVFSGLYGAAHASCRHRFTILTL